MLRHLDDLRVILARLALLQAILEARNQIAGFQEKVSGWLKPIELSIEHELNGPVMA